MSNQKININVLSKNIFLNRFSELYKDYLLNIIRSKMMYNTNINASIRILFIILRELNDTKK